MKMVVHEQFKLQDDALKSIITNYDSQGEDFGNQDRNSLKF